MPGIGQKSDKDFQAEQDVRTLAEATEIKRNKKRLNSAMTANARMERDAREAAGRARIAGGKKE